MAVRDKGGQVGFLNYCSNFTLNQNLSAVCFQTVIVVLNGGFCLQIFPSHDIGGPCISNLLILNQSHVDSFLVFIALENVYNKKLIY